MFCFLFFLTWRHVSSESTTLTSPQNLPTLASCSSRNIRVLRTSFQLPRLPKHQKRCKVDNLQLINRCKSRIISQCIVYLSLLIWISQLNYPVLMCFVGKYVTMIGTSLGTNKQPWSCFIKKTKKPLNSPIPNRDGIAGLEWIWHFLQSRWVALQK